LNVAASAEELCVDCTDLQSAGVSASIPFAISSSFFTAASRLASGRSALYFIERGTLGSSDVRYVDQRVFMPVAVKEPRRMGTASGN
jgi:hypothetical protein